MIITELRNRSLFKKQTPLNHLITASESMLINNPFSVLNQVVYNLKTKAPIPFRICLLNSFTLSTRHLAKQTLSTEKDILENEKQLIPMQFLEAEIVESLIFLASSEKEFEHFLAALLQVNPLWIAFSLLVF